MCENYTEVARLKALAQELMDLDVALITLEESLPQVDQGDIVNIKELDPLDPRIDVVASQDFFNSVLMYRSLSAAIAASHLRCTRMLVLQSLRDTQVALGDTGSCEKHMAVEKSIIKDICRSIFQYLSREIVGGDARFGTEALGGMRGVFLFWPVKAVTSASELTPPLATDQQVKFLKVVATYLYRRQGIPQARHFFPIEE